MPRSAGAGSLAIALQLFDDVNFHIAAITRFSLAVTVWAIVFSVALLTCSIVTDGLMAETSILPPPISVDVGGDLTEWDYGVYEGRRTGDLRAERPGWRLLEDGCPGGETLDAVTARAERVIDRIRALQGDVLVFAHRHILRVITASWLTLPAVDARKFELTTASLSILGYYHDLDEPVVRLWNDTRR